MSEFLVSFIIPHRGRENLLVETLRSISEQNFDLSAFEVVIVSQNEKLSPSVHGFENQLNLTIFHRPVSETISALRNFGVKQSQSKFLAFLDADIFLSSNWLAVMLQTLAEHENSVIASAVQRNSSNAPPLEKIRTALSNPVMDAAVNFLPGRNLFLRRETFSVLGGFPESLVTCEDYYFTSKANQIGDLFYTSKANYVHLGEDKEFAEMFKKEIWRGQSNLMSLSGREIPLNEIPSFIVPVGLLGLFVLAAAALVFGNYWLFAVSLMLFLVPLALYTLRLFFLTRDQKVPFRSVLQFYLFYFPARAIGTIGGVFRTFKSRSHGS